MPDSIYIEIIGSPYKAIFKQVIRNCNLSENAADILTGDSSGKYINRTSFTNTINAGILVEVPFDDSWDSEIKNWQTTLLNYIENDLPPGLAGKVFFHTREMARSTIKVQGGAL